MPSTERNALRQFLIFVFVLLIPCFALWSFFSAALVTPVVGLLNLLLSNWFPDIVSVVFQQGAEAVLMTQLDVVGGELPKASSSDDGIGFKVNTRIVSYSIPFYAALHFATDKKEYLASFFWGVLILYPFILLGLISICLKDLMITFGATFLEQPDVLIPGPDLIGITYQLSVLIVPSVLPILIWAFQSRDTPLMQGLASRQA